MRNIYIILFGLSNLISFAQEIDSTKTKLKFSGGYDGTGQWYTNDVNRKISHDKTPLRSNNYMLLNFVLLSYRILL